MIKVIKKDGTKEEFNVQKVVVAVNKSAYRALVTFTEEELDYLDNITWIKGSYVDFLRLWQPRYEEFTITTDAPCGLSIEAAGTLSLIHI